MKATYQEIVRSVPNSDCSFKYIEISKGETLPARERGQNALLFVLTGKIKINGAAGLPCNLSESEFVMIPKETDWKGAAMQDTTLVILRFNRVDTIWTSAKIKRLIDAAGTSPAGTYPVLAVKKPLEMFLRLIVLYTEEKEIDRSFYASKDSELLSLLYAFYPAEELGRMFRPLLHANLDFKSFVEANYLKVESASELAELAGCSLVTLNRKFKEYYNDTAYQWIMKNKMVLIKKRLQSANGSLAEIAKEFGFYSGSELNRFCQRQFGTTALKIRKQALSKEKLKS